MKKGKRLLALVVAVSLVAGLAPMSSTSYAEEAESAGNEAEGTIASDTAASYATTDVTSELGIKSLVYMDASDETNPLTLYGLTSQEGASYARMDLETAADITGNTEITYDNSVYTHARESAGGRVRFTTTSPYIAIKAVLPYYDASYEAYASDMGAGKYGFDVYLDTDEGSVYYGTIEPEEMPTEGAEWTYEGVVEFASEETRNITIYFPITHEVSEVYVGAKNSSVIVPNLVEYEDEAPIVYYGSSITQGGCVTKPGNTYVNTIGRMLNRDYINLGVWGSAKGQTAFANYIASLDMSIFVFDYDHNAGSVQALEDTHYDFYQIVRAAHPDIPIVFITRPNQTNVGTEGDTYEDTWQIVKASYAAAIDAGDSNVYFIDGQSFFTIDNEFDSSYLSDGIHPTDVGQAKMAEVIGGQLQDIIETMPAETPAYNETVLLTDTFDDGTTWDPELWNYTSNTTSQIQYYGVRNGMAPLGYASYANGSARNMYKTKLTDVHLKAKVCVTEAQTTWSSKTTYHFLFARGTDGNATDSIAFGFKTAYSALESSLVVAKYTNTDAPTILFETDASYDVGTEHNLELFVVGTVVIAKCDDKVIYADVVDDITVSAGYCGILDRRAATNLTSSSSLTSSAVYGTDYKKCGYFDDFSLATITFDSFEVNGPVVAESDGNGVADVAIYSGKVKVGEVEDVSVTALGFNNVATTLYEGTYLVKSTLFSNELIALADRIFVIDDLSTAVTNMSDARWTGTTADTEPNFKVNGVGKATLSNTTHSVLSMGENDVAYGNFYVEYILNVSGLTSGNQFAYTRLNMGARAAKNTSYSADVVYQTGQTDKYFWSRLCKWVDNTASKQWNYSNSSTEDDIALGSDMKIGMLVYGGTITYTLNDTFTARAQADSTLQGWFALAMDTTNATVSVKNFTYVPLGDKTLTDYEIDSVDKVQLGGSFSPSVTPIYSWPNEKGTTVTEGMITNFDNTKLGVQYVTVSFEGIEKTVKVEVVDYEPITDEDFADYTFNTDEWNSYSGVSVENQKVTMSGSASAYVKDTFANGFIEATVSLTDSTTLNGVAEGSSKSIYPMELVRQLDSNNVVKVRFVVTKSTTGVISASINTFVRDGDSTAHQAANYKLNDFDWDKEYKLRLTVIGNYFEVQLDGEAIKQLTLESSNTLVNQADTRFGFANTADASATLDNLLVGKYSVYEVATSVEESNEETESTVDLPSYIDYRYSSSDPLMNQRTFFLRGEEVVVTTNASEGEQLAATGGLLYTIGETLYVIEDRIGEAGETTEISNQFVFAMPSSDITVKAAFVNATQANMGIRSVSIREQQDTLKSGIRFSSRAYKQYETMENMEYTLSEVGTLLFKEGIEVTEKLLNDCYENAASDGTYTVESTVVAKKVMAQKAQDICDDYIDWGVVLTYEEDSSLIDTKYTAYSYAVYESTDGTPELVFAKNPKTYSYNDVATLVGCETH